jgi:hypothetical protein
MPTNLKAYGSLLPGNLFASAMVSNNDFGHLYSVFVSMFKHAKKESDGALCSTRIVFFWRPAMKRLNKTPVDSMIGSLSVDLCLSPTTFTP